MNMLNKRSRRADIVRLGVGYSSSNKRQETNMLRHTNFVIYIAYIVLVGSRRPRYAKHTPGFWRKRMHTEFL
jgi:hypothetical protein